MNAPELSSLRSALFVPLADDRFLAKAHGRGADALLLDLEDSVPPAQKAQARARVPGQLALRRGDGLGDFLECGCRAARDLRAMARSG